MEREFDKEILELVSKPIKSDLNCLISISGHKLLKADLVIFKVILRKWFKRLRTSKISRRFSLINSRINQFLRLDLSNNFSNKLTNLINEKYDTRIGKLEYPAYEQVTWILNCSVKTCEILCKLIRDIISVFEDCTMWIKLGHFARQMRIITAAVSRLSVFFKTIVMKICDIYPYLYTYLEIVDYVKLEEDQFSKDIFHYLKLINVDPPKNQEVKSSSKVKFKSMYENSKRNEDVGQKVSRNLFNEKTKKKLSINNDEINKINDLNLNDKPMKDLLNSKEQITSLSILKLDKSVKMINKRIDKRVSSNKTLSLKKKVLNKNQSFKVNGLTVDHKQATKRDKIKEKIKKCFQFEVVE